MGSISFNQVSSSAKASKVYVEQEAVNRGGGSPVIPRKLLVLAQYDEATKSPTEDVAQLVLDLNDAWDRYGRESMAAYILKNVFKTRGTIPVYVVPLGEDGAGVAATGTVAITGLATAAGTLNLYLGGEKISVAVAVGDYPDDVGAAIAAAVTANLDLPVDAVNVTGTVTFTCKWKGASGNQLKLEANMADTDETPTGLTVTVTTMGGVVPGANNPDVTTALAALGDTWYTDVVCPFQDTDNLAALKVAGDERDDAAVNRPLGFFVGYTDTSANYITLLSGLNCEWIVTVPVHGSSTPAMRIAASVAGAWAKWQGATPGKPMKGQTLYGVLSNTGNDLTLATRETVVAAGGSWTKNQEDGSVTTGDLVTTRITTDVGAETDDYLFALFIPNLQFKRYALETTFLASPFENAVVLDDGDGPGPTHGVRPSTVKAYAISLVDDWIARGLSTDRDTIVDNIIAEINSGNAGRIDLLIPDVMTAGLRIVAVKLEWAFLASA